MARKVMKHTPSTAVFPPMVAPSLPHPSSLQHRHDLGHPAQPGPLGTAQHSLPPLCALNAHHDHPGPTHHSQPEHQSDLGLPAQLGPVDSAQQGLPEREGLHAQPGHHAASMTSLSYVIFTGEDVKEALNQMPCSSAPGSDGMVPKLMKKAKGSISRMLANIFQHSLESGEVPALWREGYIQGVPKKSWFQN